MLFRSCFPELARKMKFELEKTGGAKNEEAVRMITDLHWPYYWTPNNGLCGDEKRCMETRQQFNEWQAEEFRKAREKK